MGGVGKRRPTEISGICVIITSAWCKVARVLCLFLDTLSLVELRLVGLSAGHLTQKYYQGAEVRCTRAC